MEMVERISLSDKIYLVNFMAGGKKINKYDVFKYNLSYRYIDGIVTTHGINQKES